MPSRPQSKEANRDHRCRRLFCVVDCEEHGATGLPQRGDQRGCRAPMKASIACGKRWPWPRGMQWAAPSFPIGKRVVSLRGNKPESPSLNTVAPGEGPAGLSPHCAWARGGNQAFLKSPRTAIGPKSRLGHEEPAPTSTKGKHVGRWMAANNVLLILIAGPGTATGKDAWAATPPLLQEGKGSLHYPDENAALCRTS